MRRQRTVWVASLAAAIVLLAACGGASETATDAATSAPAAETSATEPAQATTGAETEATTEQAHTEEGATEQAQTEGETEAEPETEATSEDMSGNPADAAIRIENGEPVGGVVEVEVRKGDRVRIVVRADAEQELHLHGYEIEKVVRPGKPAIFVFTAEFEGIFELESHTTDTLVAKLVVEP